MIQALLPLVGTVLKQVIPDPEQRTKAQQNLMELAQKGELAYLDANLQVALAQLKVNEMEAKSHGIYKGGWRPFIGWTCGAAIAYQYVARPFLAWITLLAGGDPATVPPQLDLESLWPVIAGMLGLGAMRTFERREFTRETADLAKEKNKLERKEPGFSFPETSD